MYVKKVPFGSCPRAMPSTSRNRSRVARGASRRMFNLSMHASITIFVRQVGCLATCGMRSWKSYPAPCQWAVCGNRATLRFSDHRGISQNSVKIHADGLSSRLALSKTMRNDKHFAITSNRDCLVSNSEEPNIAPKSVGLRQGPPPPFTFRRVPRSSTHRTQVRHGVRCTEQASVHARFRRH